MKTEFSFTDMFQKTLISDSVPIFMPSGPFVTKPSRCALSKIPPTKLQWDFPIPERLPEHGVAQQPVVGRPPAPPQTLAVPPEVSELDFSGQLCGVAIRRCIFPPLHQLQRGQLGPYGLNLNLRIFLIYSFWRVFSIPTSKPREVGKATA
mgnify:CR=1 FL=1